MMEMNTNLGTEMAWQSLHLNGHLPILGGTYVNVLR